MDIIFDIDGTLANIEHRRHYVQSKPKNWPAFNAAMVNDTLNAPVAKILFDLAKTGNRILVASGREETYRKQTVKWLADHGIYQCLAHDIYMRQKKDYRIDSQVKFEILQQMRTDGFDPQVAFDDRQQVVDMWRQQGLVCCQVAPGDF